MKHIPLSKLFLVLCLILSVQQVKAQSSFSSLFEKANQLYEEGQFEELLALENDLIAQSVGQADTTLANLHYYLGDASYALGDLNQAIFHFEKEKTYRAKNIDNADDYEALLSSLAMIYRENGNYKAAVSTYKEALSFDSTHFEANDPRIPDTWLAMSRAYEEEGSYTDSEKIYKRLLKQLEKTDPLYLNALSNLGNLYVLMGKYSLATKYLDQALVGYASTEGTQSPSYVGVQVNKAGLFREMGKYPEAEELYLSVLTSISKEVDPSYEDMHPFVLNNLALLYRGMGRYDESLKLLADLRAMEEEKYGPEHPTLAITYINIAIALEDKGEMAKAEENYKKAQEIVANNVGKEHMLYATAINNLATNYRKTKKYKQALPLVDQARNISMKNFGKNSPIYAQYTYNLGLLYFTLNDLKKAEPLLKEAYKTRQQELGLSHPKVGETANKMAVFYWDKGDYKSAEKEFNTTFANYFTQIEAYFPFMSEQEKAKFYNNKLRVSFEEFNSYAVSRAAANPALLGDLYTYQLQTKALIMYATNKVRENILNSGDSTLVRMYESWIAQKEQLSKLYSFSKSDLKSQGINMDSLLIEANLLEKELSKRSSLFGETYTKKNITWKDVQKQLKAGEAALEMIRFREFTPDSSGYFSGTVKYAALMITPESKSPKLILIENGNDLESKFLANYRNSIRFKIEETYSYEKYWAPIAQHLGGLKKIYFSPDGVYNQISINTLYNPATNRYVLDEIQVLLVLNTKDLLSAQAQASPRSQGQATFFGFPNYNKGLDEDASLAQSNAQKIANTVSLDRGLRGSLQRYISSNQLLALLPGTKAEVEGISALYAKENINTQTLLGDNALEERVKQVNNPSTLHIATHGFFMEDLPEGDGDENKYVENPLLRSGLILAGANSYLSGGETDVDQDGILTAYEAMNLNLDKTDLVVLSACQTGLGEVKNGEGVYGLQRSFQIAGAKAVIMSMWSVDDQATQELMTAFYSEWLSGKTKQEAFRDAQISLKEKYKSPFYWGAFVMVGE